MLDLKTIQEFGAIGSALVILALIIYKLVTRKTEPKVFSKAWMERVDRRLREYHELSQKITEMALELSLLKTQFSRLELEFRSHMSENVLVRERLSSMESNIENIKEMQAMILEKVTK